MVDKVEIRGNIGQLKEYIITEPWDIYFEKLDQYLIANYVAEDRKVAVLLTTIGDQAYKILRDLCSPLLPKEKTYKELCDILSKQFSPRTSTYRKRIEFYNTKQIKYETISDYYVRIKNAAIDCKFGIRLDEIVKDKFVTGLCSGNILDRLCEEGENKKLEELVEIALQKEATNKAGQLAVVNKIEHKIKKIEKKSGDVQQTAQLKCRTCGKGSHNFANCRYKQYICKVCKKKGHLATVCKYNKQTHGVNVVNSDKVEQEEIIDMFHLDNTEIVKPIYILLEIESIPIQMEIDSGAGVSILPEHVYLSKFCNIKLLPTLVKLRAYDGKCIKPSGEIEVNISYKDVKKKVRLIIVKGGCRPLLGRDILQYLNILNALTETIANVQILTFDLKLKKLLMLYQNLFKNELGKYKYENISINIKQNVRPIFHKPRPIAFAFREGVDKELDRLESEGVITKVDCCEWGTPLVPVLKPNKTIRLCADYKITVNKFIEDFQYPLPRIEEIFTALQGGQAFSKLDFLNAYNQLELDDDSGRLLSWSTHRGLYKLNRLPYGTKPACSLFQKIVEKVLQGCKGVVNFLDDIVVTGKTTAEHLENLENVFNKLQDAGFKLNLQKCKFFEKEIKYLGHIIDSKGLKKDPEKVRAIMECSRPLDVNEVRTYIGMINYYGKFCPNLSSTLEPLYNLLKVDVKFHWDEECSVAFKKSKELIVSDLILVHFNQELPVKLACDASAKGIGAVISHIFDGGEERPIAFASRVLTKAERNYSVIHKEALALYWGVRKFYQYLAGRQFTLETDHKPLLALFGESKGVPQMAAGRLQRWAVYLAEFDYRLQYVKGRANSGADGLSRFPIEHTQEDGDTADVDYLHFLENGLPIDALQIRAATRNDRILGQVYRYIYDGWPARVADEYKAYEIRKNELSVEKGIIMWGYRTVVPEKLKRKLLDNVHGTHLGICKMKALARGYFWYPGLDKDIENLVRSCPACLSVRAEPGRASLIKWEKTAVPFERIHLDFFGPVCNKTFLILTDNYSKWVEVIEMKRMDSMTTIEKLREIFARYGLPSKMVTDNGRQFVSAEFLEFCNKNKIKHITPAPYHPASNGAAENAVKSVKQGIYKAMKDSKNKNVSLSTIISRYLFSYRNTPHSETQESPAKLMFGRKLKTHLDLLRSDTLINTDRQVQNFKGKRDVKFEEGEEVYARDYRNPNKKEWRKATIVEVLGDRTYLVELEEDKIVWKRHLDQLLKMGDYYSQDNRNQDLTITKCDDKGVNISQEGNYNAEAVKTSLRDFSEHKPVTEQVDDSEANQPEIKTKSPQLELNIHSRPKRSIKPPTKLNL